MDEALRVYSWQGILKESIRANEIKSRPDARKLGPFADYQRKRVGWVKRSKIENTNRWKRAYFRHLPVPSSKIAIQEEVCHEFEERDSERTESPRHRYAKESIAAYLRKLLESGEACKWAFVDKRVSDLPITGNLLSDVIEVKTEYPIHTPFGKDYKLDIALLGKQIVKKPLVLGAIEIEFSHKFEMSKCLLCKALGFPLVSLDVTETPEGDFSEHWVKRLLETTLSSGDMRRRNYFYIHYSLYPVYMDLPDDIYRDPRHQYIIFTEDKHFNNLLGHLRLLKQSLSIDGDEVLIQPVQCKNDQMLTMLQNEGSIAGHDWAFYNTKRYIRVTLERPITKAGPVYKYHLAMANLLNSYYETLVGYKYARTINNAEPDNHIWQATKRDGTKIAVLPKHVSEPLKSIFAILNTIE